MKKLKITSILLLLIMSLACQHKEKKNQEVELEMEEPNADSTAALQMDNKIQAINESDLIGRWVEPNPINKKEVQGFELFADKNAKSINMETLKYKKWSLEKNKLKLTAESIGNHSRGTDTSEYIIKKLDATTLILLNGSLEIVYTKQKK